LLCARNGGWQVEVVDKNPQEAPYVAMTRKLQEAFPMRGGSFRIEPDASSGSYFLAAEILCPSLKNPKESAAEVATKLRCTISVADWPKSGWQIDEAFPRILRGCYPASEREFESHLRLPERAREQLRAMQLGGVISRATDLGDSIMTAIVLAPFAPEATRFTDLGRLRVQECERVTALRSELTKCGAKVTESGDMLEVFPSELHGAEIETYNDHRMAMCFAILGLKVSGIKIKNPSCVKKTFPNFFQKLFAPPPQGLGVTIRDARVGRILSNDDLLAE
jgi:3-phosphoshikimate 1-carboxyvinyltransferase